MPSPIGCAISATCASGSCWAPSSGSSAALAQQSSSGRWRSPPGSSWARWSASRRRAHSARAARPSARPSAGGCCRWWWRWVASSQVCWCTASRPRPRATAPTRPSRPSITVPAASEPASRWSRPSPRPSPSAPVAQVDARGRRPRSGQASAPSSHGSWTWMLATRASRWPAAWVPVWGPSSAPHWAVPSWRPRSPIATASNRRHWCRASWRPSPPSPSSARWWASHPSSGSSCRPPSATPSSSSTTPSSAWRPGSPAGSTSTPSTCSTGASGRGPCRAT